MSDGQPRLRLSLSIKGVAVAKLNPYLSFGTNAREAMSFYRDVLGGDLDISTFGQFGAEPPVADQVMHASLETPSGMSLMASDTPPGMDSSAAGGFAISLSGDDESELRGYWDKLAEGGTVVMPLEVQMWGDLFGQVVDKFGVTWMVNIAGSAQA